MCYLLLGGMLSVKRGVSIDGVYIYIYIYHIFISCCQKDGPEWGEEEEEEEKKEEEKN